MQTVTEILIDFSWSMNDKLLLTKRALLDEIIPNLDYSTQIGIKTFFTATTKDHVPIINTILPLSLTNKEQIFKAVNNISNPSGNTPIAKAIKSSVDSLNEYPVCDKKIILITDGEETCGGDYISEVNNAKSKGINCQIHIIGIGLSLEATQKAESISKMSNGTFSHIPFTKGTTYDQSSVKQNLTSFFTAIKLQTNTSTIITDKVKPIKIESPSKQELKPILKADIQAQTFTSVPQKKINKDLDSPVEDEILEVIEDKELNERIRKASEEYLFEVLKKKYPGRVKWLNENEESYSDHDFEILDLDNTIEYYIECKGTPKNKPTFYMTKDEWWLFLNHSKNYQVFFVQNALEYPNHVFIDNLLDWFLKGKVVPYLKEPQVIKEDRVFLTLMNIDFTLKN